MQALRARAVAFSSEVKFSDINGSNITTSKTLSHRVYGKNNRCEKLKSLRSELYVTSVIDVLLSQGKVCTDVFTVYIICGARFTLLSQYSMCIVEKDINFIHMFIIRLFLDGQIRYVAIILFKKMLFTLGK